MLDVSTLICFVSLEMSPAIRKLFGKLILTIHVRVEYPFNLFTA